MHDGSKFKCSSSINTALCHAVTMNDDRSGGGGGGSNDSDNTQNMFHILTGQMNLAIDCTFIVHFVNKHKANLMPFTVVFHVWFFFIQR